MLVYAPRVPLLLRSNIWDVFDLQVRHYLALLSGLPAFLQSDLQLGGDHAASTIASSVCSPAPCQLCYIMC